MTESMMLEEPDLAQTTLREIRQMGVRLALDDFGTGYSSLSLLQQFPIQRIKIDRAFVQGIAEHSNDRSLVRTDHRDGTTRWASTSSPKAWRRCTNSSRCASSNATRRRAS